MIWPRFSLEILQPQRNYSALFFTRISLGSRVLSLRWFVQFFPRDSNRARTHIFGINLLFPWLIVSSVVTLPRRYISMYPTLTGTVQKGRIRIRDVIEINSLARRWYGCWFEPLATTLLCRDDDLNFSFRRMHLGRIVLGRWQGSIKSGPSSRAKIATSCLGGWLRKSQIATVTNDWPKRGAIHRKPFQRLGRSNPKKRWGLSDPL